MEICITRLNWIALLYYIIISSLVSSFVVTYVHYFIFSKSYWWTSYSKSNRWTPKLSYQFFDMNLNNAYCIYKILHREHNQGQSMMTMPKATKDTTHALLQRGDKMQIGDSVHPSAICDFTNIPYMIPMLEPFKVTQRMVLLVIVKFEQE